MQSEQELTVGPLTQPLRLVTGATGYIGGRLLRALHERGERVRCMARRPDELRARAPDGVEVVRGDVLDPPSLAAALHGIHTAYYLIHAMAAGHGFAHEEHEGAGNFAQAARVAGVQRIVYLGGLGRDGELSPHLASRHEVGRLLRESGVPTIEFRSAVIIGSGSLSFELVRALVERLPVMTTPRWVSQPTQPIAIDDVIAYLITAATVPLNRSEIVEIGGADRVSYLDLMREYAKQRGLHRAFVPVPVLTPWLSSRWLGLVTPVYARVGRMLIEGVRNETVVTSKRASELFPEIHPRGMRKAIAHALANEDREFAETRWSDASSSVGKPAQRDGDRPTGPRRIDTRQAVLAESPASAFRAIERIGGTAGWYYGDRLWRLRGFLDLLVGGAGLRRGRRHPQRLHAGDALDFWRVEAIEPGRLLRLRAEMKLPGRAWLQFEVSGDGSRSVIQQTAIFEPRGLAGLLYWYALYPVHNLIFGGM
ncbi:MAG TPA: SDR family oxidoreductase, partial [Longimicrobiales bacterium]|nr:SDR family oxidoreductase [Longimicrobiales bacterium]